MVCLFPRLREDVTSKNAILTRVHRALSEHASDDGVRAAAQRAALALTVAEHSAIINSARR
jgi:hypothetical protein